MTFATFDPGKKTGIAIWNETIADNKLFDLVSVSTLVYKNADDFLHRVQAIRDHYGLQFAIIEKYLNFGRQYTRAFECVVQQTIIMEQFANYILIPKNVWDSTKMKVLAQKKLIQDYGYNVPKNEHERDVIAMMIRIFNRLPVDNEQKAQYLFDRAKNHHTIGSLLK